MKSAFKSFLSNKKKVVYQLPEILFKDIFWEENEDNMYYGHYDIFKKYTGCLLPFKINGEVQHGWAPHSGITSLDLNSNDSSLKNNRYYVFNERNRDISLKAGYKNVLPIGSPFIYILNPKQYFSSKIFKSLIVFPTHSHEWSGFKDPFKAYKKYLVELKKIANFFSNISVSLGWAEYKNSNIVKMFKENNMSVVCMGHRTNNPSFLIKFIKEVSKHDYVSSDALSTAIFYSLYMKKKTFLYGNIINKKNLWSKHKSVSSNILSNNLYPQLLWDSFDHESHHYIAEEELGSKYKKTPKELCQIFGWNRSSIKKFLPFQKILKKLENNKS